MSVIALSDTVNQLLSGIKDRFSRGRGGFHILGGWLIVFFRCCYQRVEGFSRRNLLLIEIDNHR